MTTPNQERAPTEKMIAAGVKAAERHGLTLPEDFKTDYAVAKEFLDKYLAAPSPKAIAFAEILAEKHRLTVPIEAMRDYKILSAWIDDHKTA